jgi:hypothetical protein
MLTKVTWRRCRIEMRPGTLFYADLNHVANFGLKRIELMMAARTNSNQQVG